MIDINYPVDGNWLGKGLVTLWKSAGDLVRDLHPVFARFAVDYTDEEIGGHGSVHLYVVRSAALDPHQIFPEREPGDKVRATSPRPAIM